MKAMNERKDTLSVKLEKTHLLVSLVTIMENCGHKHHPSNVASLGGLGLAKFALKTIKVFMPVILK